MVDIICPFCNKVVKSRQHFGACSKHPTYKLRMEIISEKARKRYNTKEYIMNCIRCGKLIKLDFNDLLAICKECKRN